MESQASVRFLVTAGSTRERIDSVRQWGNIFTGKTGLAIARELARIGPVDLVTSNEQHLRELSADAGPASSISARAFESHADLKRLLAGLMARWEYRAVFMTAAVSDYRPAGVFEVVSRERVENQERWIVRDAQAAKIRSQYEQIAVVGERTEKLVDLFRAEWGHKGLLVKFKLEVDVEVDELLSIGRASRSASGADYLVANTLQMVAGPRAGAYLIGQTDRAEFIARDDLPARLAALVAEAG